MSRLVAFSLVVLGIAAGVPSSVSARAVCGHRGQQLRHELDAASSVFMATIEGAATDLPPLPSGLRGSAGADVQMVVTGVLKGPLQVGDRVTVRWEGWSEPDGGRIAGGCRVPATEASDRFPIQMIVIAHGHPGHLRTRNDSTSQRVGSANRSVVRRITRLVRQGNH